jgi:predicted dithiol-disulfide oxidoreductase (DUF899 family)
MSDTVLAPLHNVHFPGESDDYRRARDELLRAEIALRRQTEAVAAQRRALPCGGRPPDYQFEEGDEARPVRLSQLFGQHSTLIAYSFMYGPAMEEPCPSCTSILDCLDRAARHLVRRAPLVVVAKSPIGRIRALAKERGWTQLRLVSSARNTYNRDYRGETADGDQRPALNVFSNAGGEVRHRYCTELMFAPADPGEDPRHVDSIWPLWGALDFTPEGRGDFRPQLIYD